VANGRRIVTQHNFIRNENKFVLKTFIPRNTEASEKGKADLNSCSYFELSKRSLTMVVKMVTI
jgi:hypothetical protein